MRISNLFTLSAGIYVRTYCQRIVCQCDLGSPLFSYLNTFSTKAIKTWHSTEFGRAYVLQHGRYRCTKQIIRQSAQFIDPDTARFKKLELKKKTKSYFGGIFQFCDIVWYVRQDVLFANVRSWVSFVFLFEYHFNWRNLDTWHPTESARVWSCV